MMQNITFTTLIKIAIISVCIISFSFVKSQNVEFVKEKFPDKKTELKDALKQIKDGDAEYESEAYGTGKYRRALPFYLEANKFNPNNALLNYKIGHCYTFTKEKVNAIKYLEKAKKLNPNINKEVNYLLGVAYQLEYAFDIATDYFKNYKQSLTPEELLNKRSEIDKHIQECGVGAEFMKERTRAFIDNIGKVVNSPFPDYGPLISADESVMIFTSRRDNTTGGQKSPIDDEFYEDIYISYNVNGKWSAPQSIGDNINTDIHDATVNLTPDGQKLFVYKDLGPTKGAGDIFECKLEGDEWSKPKKLPKEINSDFHESSACYSQDGKTIYFVSDKPGGLGGRDIYSSVNIKKDKWSDAVNLGPVINTKYDEEGVFIHPDGKTLYFSSKGHKNMGGYDIFKSVLDNGKWSEPENLGYPINTPDHDVYYVVSASGKHGYYASERFSGFGEKDIYMVTMLGPEKPVVLNVEDNLLASLTEPVGEVYIAPVVEETQHLPTILKGIISDAVTKKSLFATIELVDNVKNEVIASFESNSKTGKYLVTLPSGTNYGIAVKAENYLFHSENFDIPEVSEYREIVKDIELKNIAVGNKIVLKNIFFDFNKATLRPESYAELGRLIKLLGDVPSLKIEISGHTDNVGSAEYNQKLSESRAKAVVDFLTKSGIDAGRLTFKGYGMNAPIAKNDTEEGRQENRRTEFKILSN